MGLRDRRTRNERRRANGIEPEPGPYSGANRWARYLKRVVLKPVKIKHPEKYLNSSSKKVIYETTARGFESWRP